MIFGIEDKSSQKKMSDITITKLSLFTLFIRTRCLTQTCIKMKTRYKINAELPLMLAESHFHPVVSPTWKVKALVISVRKAIAVYCPGLWPPPFLLTLSSPWKTFISISPVLSVVPAGVITVCDFFKSTNATKLILFVKNKNSFVKGKLWENAFVIQFFIHMK